MTVLADPPSLGDVHAPAEVPRSAVATWRFASRLARREVRRRPGRTALVALLVAVPVFAMTVASVIYRTADDDWATEFARRWGAADIAVRDEGWYGSVAVPRTDPPADVADHPIDVALDAVLPDGARVVDVVEVRSGIELTDGSVPVWLWITDLPLDDPITEGIVEIRDGRAPASADEVLLDRATADRLGVAVGDVLTLSRPSGDWLIVGIGRAADQLNRPLMVMGELDRSRVRPEYTSQVRLVDLPAGTDTEAATAVGRALVVRGFWADSRWESQFSGRGDWGRALAWGWVAGVLALVAVGIVIAAAFATSARRQLVTIGQLAANGAPRRLVARTLALQGTWSGAVGALAGVSAALASLVVFRSLAERVVNTSLAGYRVVPTDLVVIVLTAVVAATAAAVVPARTAARVPVMSALAGRRPLGRPPRRLVPIGVALFIGGLGLLFVAATGVRTSGYEQQDLFGLVAVLGGVAVVFGMCCATPLAVALVGRLGGSSASGIWRLAARSTARARTRSAGVVTAIGVTGAVAVAGVTLTAVMAAEDRSDIESLPRNVVYLEQFQAWGETETTGLIDVPPLVPFELDAEVAEQVRAILPDAEWFEVRAAGFDPRPIDERALESGTTGPGVADPLMVRQDSALAAIIAEPTILDLIGYSDADRQLLDRVDLVERRPFGFQPYSSPIPALPDDGTYRAVFGDVDGDITVVAARASSGRSLWQFRAVMRLERAQELGFEVVHVGMLLRNPVDLTDVQRGDLQRLFFGGEQPMTAFIEPGDPATSSPSPFTPTPTVSPEMSWGGQRADPASIDRVILIAAVLLTLLVVAIGLSLSATESREERDVLVAVGARPRTLAGLAGAKAVVLAGLGVVLAVPTGYLPTWVVWRAFNSPDWVSDAVPARFPWPMVTLLVVVVPLVAGVVSWTVSNVAQRARPPRMSALRDD